MLNVTGIIKLNEADSIYFDSPAIDTSATITYDQSLWSVLIYARLVTDKFGLITKTYSVPSVELTKLDDGTGQFAAKLGFFIESIVSNDLQSINPDAQITII